jgi:acyl CoA:acetate/3-ketoacid CoA transferase beta subunit
VRTVSYKKAYELKSKDVVIFPDDSTLTVAGKIVRGKKVEVTFIGGKEREFESNYTLKLLGTSQGKMVPGYMNSYGMR